MGLKIVVGRAGSGKSAYCLAEIRQRLLRSQAGQPLLLIVPEQATFQAERALAATPGLQGFMRAYVFGFRRLAYRVLQETGGAARRHVTELGKRLVLSRLLTQHKEKLTVLAKAARQPTFVDTLATVIAEFKTYGITPEQLATIQPGLVSPLTAAKLTDLGLIYREFTAFLANRYTDPEDYLKLLAAKISQSELVEGAEVWVDGFSWFTPQESAVLAEIMRVAEKVTVTLCLEDPDSRAHQNEEALFHVQWSTYHKLLNLANRLPVTIEQEKLKASRRFTANRFLAGLENRLAGGTNAPYNGLPQGLTIAEAANRRVEIEGMARDIIRLCREEGCRWRDIAVIMPDPENYGEITEAVLADYGIPFFSERRRPAIHHPLAELLRSSLEVVTGRWAYEPVFRCLKTGLFPLSDDQIDMLENYVLEFGIRGSRWTQTAPWNYVRQLSLEEDTQINPATQEYLHKMNELRTLAVTPLAAMERAVRQAADARRLTEALYALLLDLDVAGQLEALASAAEAAGDLEQAREHQQLWRNVIELLDQIVETCGDQTMTPAEYSEILNEGLKGLTLSLIPPGLDYVTVASLDNTRINNARGVYLPGVNDGALPPRVKDDGLISGQERSALAKLGLELAPGGHASAFAGQFNTYTALTRASEYLWVSYSLADEEGRALSPSLLIGQLKEYAGRQATLKSLPLEPPEGCEKEYLVHPQQSLSLLAGRLEKYSQGAAMDPVLWDVYNWALTKPFLANNLKQVLAGLFHRNQEAALPAGLAARLYRQQHALRGSVTRFESYRACPFQHFARYGLGLKERAVFQLKAPDMGQFFHAVLRRFGERLAEEGRNWGDLSDSESAAVCGEIMEQLVPKLQHEILLSTGQYQHLQGRLRRTVELAVRRLGQFDRVSAFKPVAFEQAFGRKDGAWPPLVLTLGDGSRLELAGQIDRLDCAEYNGQKYILIIDYKSGGAWLQLADVYYGLRLQLLTYLLAVSRLAPGLFSASPCRPAGILYFFVRNPAVAEPFLISEEEIRQKVNNQLRMPGWVLAEQEVIRLLDSQIQGRSEFLKVALKKDNTFYTNCLSYVKTAEQFNLLLKYAEHILGDTAEQILAGDIMIQPFRLSDRSPCGLCAYRPVCQFDHLLADNTYNLLPDLTDAVIYRTLAAGEGGEKE